MTSREKQILECLRTNPLISQKELAQKFGIKRSSVAVHIGNLTKKGYIKGKGYILQEGDYAVVIGGANLDIAGFSTEPLVMRDSNPGRIRISSGGVGRNIAQNLVKLGIKTRLISAVGNDVFGRQIIEDCKRGGIDTSLVKTSDQYASSVYLSILNNTGDMDLALNDMAIMEMLTIDSISPCHQVIDAASAIVVDTNISRELLQHLSSKFKNQLFLDTVSTAKTQKVIDCIGFFNTIKPNRKEAEILVGFKINSVAGAERAVQVLLDKGVSTVVITLGKEGVVYGTAGESGKFRLDAGQLVNTTGSGDAFMAVLVYGALNELGLYETVKLASVASYLTLKNESSMNTELSIDLLEKTKMELNL